MGKQPYKHMDVDVIAFLEEKMKSNTKHYQSDFEIDKQMFNRLVMNPHKEDKTLLWLSRSHGTQCQKEFEVFIKDTAAHNTWMYYADSSEPIVAYAVELSGKDHGIIRGNLYELDYKAHAAQVPFSSVESAERVLTFQDGFEHRTPAGRGSYWYYAPLVEEHGAIVHSLELPKDKEAHAIVLAEQKAARDKMKTANKSEELEFIFDEEVQASQDLTQMEGYVWASDSLISRLKEQEPPLEEDQFMENINFYPVFDGRSQTVSLEGHYYLEDAHKATGKAFTLPLTPEENARLKEAFEAYCQKTDGMSCIKLLNQFRREAGLQPIPQKSLDSRIAAAAQQSQQNNIPREKQAIAPER